MVLIASTLGNSQQETLFKVLGLRITKGNRGTRILQKTPIKRSLLSAIIPTDKRLLQEGIVQDALMSTLRKSGEDTTRIQIYFKPEGAPVSKFQMYELTLTEPFSTTFQVTQPMGTTNPQLQIKHYPRMNFGFYTKPANGKTLSFDLAKIILSYRSDSYKPSRRKTVRFTRVYIESLEIRFASPADLSAGTTRTLKMEGYQGRKENEILVNALRVIFILGTVMSVVSLMNVWVFTKKIADQLFCVFPYSFSLVISWFPLSYQINEASLTIPFLCFLTRNCYLAIIVYLFYHCYEELPGTRGKFKFLFSKGLRWVMWLVGLIWSILCFMVLSFTMYFNLFLSLLVCIIFFGIEVDRRYMGDDYSIQVLKFFLMSNLPHSVVIYLYYWSEFERKFGAFTFTIFRWLLPDLISVGLIPFFWSIRIPFAKKVEASLKVTDLELVKGNGVWGRDPHLDPTDHTKWPKLKLWMDFSTPSLLFFKNSQKEKQFHQLPHFDRAKIKEMFGKPRKAKGDCSEIKMLCQDPQNVFSSLTLNFHTVMKYHSRNLFCGLCFIPDMRKRREKLLTSRDAKSQKNSEKVEINHSFTLRLIKTKFENVLLIKRVWRKNQLDKSLIAIASKNRHGVEYLSLISVKTRRLITRLRVEGLEFKGVKTADVVITKTNSVRLFLGQEEKLHAIFCSPPPRRSRSIWRERGLFKFNLIRETFKIAPGSDYPNINKAHQVLSFMNFSFHDDLVLFTYLKCDPKASALIQRTKPCCKTNGGIILRISLEISKYPNKPNKIKYEELGSLTAYLHQKPKIDLAFFLNSKKLAFLMKDTLWMTDVEKNQQFIKIPIANMFDYCTLRKDAKDQEQYFTSGLFDRRNKRINFSVGRFSSRDGDSPKDWEYYLPSAEMVSVKYYVSGSINLREIVDRLEGKSSDDETMSHSKIKGNRMEILELSEKSKITKF